MRAPASALAAHLFRAAGATRALPFWADGGAGHRPPFEPGRHYLAALPDRVERLRVADLPRRGLIPWLRARLPPPRPGAPRAPLTVVALAYDAGRNLELLPSTAREDPVMPDVVVARYPAFIEADGEEGPWRLVATDRAAREALRAHLSAPAAPPPAPATRAAAPRSHLDRGAHRAALQSLLSAIRAGDLYQANIARRLETRLSAAATPDLYRALRAASPAAFGALWSFDEGHWIASVSPECLFDFDPASRRIRSFPIKGTRPRGADPREDAAQRRALRADPKDRAEHIMIVDLVRNDLGRIAELGSVAVDRPLHLSTFPTVHHLISEVRATVTPGSDLADIIAALFPGGSITGAPKIAAMTAIEHLEGLRRGFYTGSLGLAFGDGAAVFNILIRTAVAASGRLLYQTGGGIVADSDPDAEWRETEIKALAFERALATL